MATYSKLFLSGGSGDGTPIAVGDTDTIIHTAHATSKDEIWLYAVNIDTAARELTLKVGGTGDSNKIVLTVQPQAGLVQVLPGIPMSGSDVLYAVADTAAKINLVGWVNRIG